MEISKRNRVSYFRFFMHIDARELSPPHNFCLIIDTPYISHLYQYLANNYVYFILKWTYLYFWKHVYCPRLKLFNVRVWFWSGNAFIDSYFRKWLHVENPKISFPINSHGVMFAIVELTSSLINFSQIPITTEVKLNQNFDQLTYLLIGLSLVLVVRIVSWIRDQGYLAPEALIRNRSS